MFEQSRSRSPERRCVSDLCHDERGFTLIELLISSLIMSLVLGGSVALATQVQRAYQMDLDNVAVEQEARYALDWIAREVRSAASDPYGVIPVDQRIWIDPNGGGIADDSIRIQADINPVDGDIADPGENVTIDLNGGSIRRRDVNNGNVALPMTDAIFTDLAFTFLDASRTPTADSTLVAYIGVTVTAQSRGRNFYTGGNTSSTLSTEVRVRTR